jgi:heme/copper-type cytochrome/quinol oxidase subunit 1
MQSAGAYPMFGAKLFAIAAIVITVIALVQGRLTDTTFDFYVHATYIVVAARHAILGVALLCGAFAGFYYFGDRGLGLRLNNGMSLAHFLLWIFSFVVFALELHGFVEAIRSQQNPNQTYFVLVRFTVPMLTFIAAAALFLLNLAWAMVLKFKTT